jgi:hypothetical protein
MSAPVEQHEPKNPHGLLSDSYRHTSRDGARFGTSRSSHERGKLEEDFPRKLTEFIAGPGWDMWLSSRERQSELRLLDPGDTMDELA